MPHPWDLHHVWRYSTSVRLQLECVATGILGGEAALYAHLELERLLLAISRAQRAARRRARP